ncbi:MAG: restriction endonuclease subunit S, partial [Clostridia bacterium]|nr:restriction endonuclease subunit S [Clostridia bacterium]
MEMKVLKELLTAMQFSPVSGTENSWEKLYSMADNYRISVKLGDTPSSTHIDYGNKIICGRTTTMNVSQPETMVVLECVNRLLEKGYHPDSIQLEKGWRVGGYLDIYVTDLNNDGYLMIECKQYGEKYNIAKEIILTNDYKKEQLFNYFLNDKNPKFLLLYSSMLSDTGDIIYQNDIIETMSLKHCATQEELYNTWDKNFISKAIFEKGILPYRAERSSLLKRDLQPLDVATIKVDGKEGSIYNLFAEILRRYTVSDKSNAYDKIFNMFLCKIVDEDKTDETEELEFQWKETDTAETVLTRLNDLYTKGMNEYLSLHVADITEEDFEKELRLLTYGMEADTSRLQAMFREIRLYKNTTFAFREIIDKKAFEENAEIVKAVVLLLQKYRIRYNHKQRYLSEFFERLLNIGIKQEAGQFFTPVPIAEFVCNAIDVENIIRKKVERKEGEFLPYTIDFACGSGHFITSMMDRIDDVVKR